jgi:hypothetical protein
LTCILIEAFAAGVRLDFVCGDEVNGACTQLREYLEDHGQAYELQISSSFRLSLPGGVRSPASRPPPGWVGVAGRSAPPGRDPKGSAGTPRRGWDALPLAATC